MSRELRDYQVDGIRECYREIRNGTRRIMLQAATGAGKTRLAAAIIQHAVERGRRVYFTVPAVVLIDQTYKAFFAEGIYSLGVIQANHPMTNSSRRVQIASVQTLARRNVAIPDIVIVDEAHRRDKNISRLMRDPEWAQVIWIGLSATPWAKGLGEDYEVLHIVATTADLISRGYLSPFRCFAPSHPDLSGIKTGHDGELEDAGHAKAMTPLTGDIVENWLRHGEGRPTLCFCVTRAHSAAVADSFDAAGIPCAHQDCDTPDDERKEIARRFSAGEIKVVCNVGTLTTGVDWDVRCIILARHMKSEMLYVQIVGRGLRTAEGKDDLIIFDHGSTIENLGQVTEIHHDELHDGKSRKAADRTDPEDRKEPLPKPCPSCHYLKPVRVHACPNCGFTPRPADLVEVVDGELIEIGKRKPAKREPSWEERQTFHAELKRYVEEYQKKPGLAAVWYKEKFGVWPNDPRVRGVPPADVVSPVTAAWIRSRNIAYAKRMRAMGA